jgi:hypothetical protein
MASYYFPSGQFKPQALVIVPAASAAASSVLGVVCAVLFSFFPEFYFKMPLLVLWGFFSVFLSKWAIQIGALRAPVKSAALVFVGTLVGYYVHFAFYSAIAASGNIQPGASHFSLPLVLRSIDPGVFGSFLLDPAALLGGAKNIYIFGLPDKEGVAAGVQFYGLLWLIDLVLYETFPLALAYRYAGEPYEEDLQSWLVRQKLKRPYIMLPDDPKELNAVFTRIAEGDISCFLSQVSFSRLRGSFLGLELYFEEGAPDACVTVRHYIKTVKRASESVLVKHLLIPEVQAERLMKNLS